MRPQKPATNFQSAYKLFTATILVAIFCLGMTAPLVSAQDTTEISLKSGVLADTVKFPSWHHLNFNQDPSSTNSFPSAWTGIAMCPLMKNATFSEVDVARFKDAKGSWQYAVDADADGTFDEGSILKFEDRGGHALALVDVTVKRNSGGEELPKITYQISSDSLGLSARIGEYRQGIATIDGKKLPVRLVLSSVNKPYFSTGKGTFAIIDLNQDGRFQEKWQVGPGGEFENTEVVSWDKPFMVDNKGYMVTSINPSATSMVWQSFLGSTALSPGFKAPSWSATDMNGVKVGSDSLAGNVSLLFFWSPTCHFCESIRPKLDEMTSVHRNQPFRLVAFTTERNLDTLKAFLAKSPYAGTIVPYDAAAWTAYNSKMLTPTYCLVDKDGIVRLYGAGASFFTAINKMTTQLLAGK